MHLAIFLFCCCPFLVNTDPITTTPASTPSSTETATVNTIDVLQNQLNQILVQFCASEIDRNKTASAILKFGQLADAKVSVKNVVQFYTENYDENFDNLLVFIGHISSFELQQIAYNTLVEAVSANRMNVINVLSLENFIRTKFELIDEDSMERRTYQVLLSTIGYHLKELIVGTDLNRLIAYINNSANPDRIFELIPTIVQGIDLNNFTDMNRIFEFSMQLPKGNQIKLISKVLAEMRTKSQYRHVFHVICQIRLLRNSIINRDVWAKSDICSLSALEHEIPLELKDLISEETRWQIKYDSELLLSFADSSRYGTIPLSINSNGRYGLLFESQNYNSVSIPFYNHGMYFSVAYCFHNDSFPTVTDRDNSDLTQNNWYLLMDNGLTDVQIKNIYTNEFLISEVASNESNGVRVALSANCSDCSSSKWSLNLQNNDRNRNIYSSYSCSMARWHGWIVS